VGPPGAADGARAWQIAALLPQPPLSLLHLLLIRAERVPPSFAPVVLLGVLPLASLAIGLRRRARSRAARGAGEVALLCAALLELAWAVLSAAMVGFAIAWRSG
jgi:hypothetical protein